ncbi:ABC transporter substrate-binding protein [Pulveribacter suum]|uniref:ABC transporter substrate-binding protein n=1 Tax=Pulveribacter suum TaxID=2116657 RepID=A0A2P1NNW2_9BURK|nr:ABC transporter substrate-binding protein [Pulveribacter suum]AVP58750.1 ABC transporter substrate-binding protein [Pulveribacter suum]
MPFKRYAAALVAAGALLSPALHAKTFKWTSQGDISTWDIHAQNLALQNGLHANVYESLVHYNSRSFEVEPQLATSWKAISPTQMRFSLRQGVKFQDGSAFTADDAAFSINRALAKTSQFGPYAVGIAKAVKVDAQTLDVMLTAPNPVLLRQMTELRIMSRAWAEKNKATEPLALGASGSDSFAHRNAMGTGPYILESWQPGVRMVFKRNPNWWGTMEGNVTDIVYLTTPSAASRTAALVAGDVDLVLDPAPQDLRRLRASSELRVLDGVENRTIFFGMDQHSSELPGSTVKGKNPLKDVRVRRAMYQAIDMDTISHSLMRGLGKPTGALVSPQVAGWTEAVGQRQPYNVESAKQLMAEAGYGTGFNVDLACPANRYIHDEAICQAVMLMWARIGVMAKVRTMPMSAYLPMIQRHEASVYMLGWGVPTFDAYYSLEALVQSVGKGGGEFNFGRYSNARADELIQRIKVEPDGGARKRLMTQALQLVNDDVAYIPLHDQVIPWAARKNVELVHRADNRVDMRTVRVN